MRASSSCFASVNFTLGFTGGHMPKQIQGLRKRTGNIQYMAEGKNLQQGPIEVGDIVQFVHDNGASINVRVDTPQEEGTLIGTVIKMSADAPGILVDDSIVSHEDFVFMVMRKT